MGKASRTKRGAVKAATRRRTTGSLLWYSASAFVVLVGVVLIVLSRGSGEASAGPKANFDHWHVAFGVNVCGTWIDNAPEFEYRSGSSVVAGVHSHGDGLIHIHPYTSDESGDRTTLGLYLGFGGWSASPDGFALWGGETRTNGDLCGDQPGRVRWSVNGSEKTGDPAEYAPRDQDVIALAFLPEGAEIGEPPQKASLAAPSDLEPGELSPATGESVPGESVPGESVPPDDGTGPDGP